MNQPTKIGNYRWTICALLFFATTINYLDRQVLSLTWKDFIAPEFYWTNTDYGNITALFSIFYAFSLLFVGQFIDRLGTKKGFLWAIIIWSIGACMHAFCGIATSGVLTGNWFTWFLGAKGYLSTVSNTALIASTSVSFFIFSRLVLAFGEAGNYPAAIKTIAEYFPKKDRAFATSILNAGATVGALIAPLSVPFIAKAYGWEMSFIIIGALGFIWMGFWIFMYNKPESHSKVTSAELTYIQQDKLTDVGAENETKQRKVSVLICLQYKQTWAFAFAKFMTDGVWWFFLFWAPAYLSSVYKMDSTQSAFPLLVLYLITLLSIFGGWLPTYYIVKLKMNVYDSRMKAMFIFALLPLLALLAQPLAQINFWIPIVIIGIACAAHQSWSANIFSVVSDMFPKKAIGTVTGIGGMAGGIGSYFINKGSGILFDYTEKNQFKFLKFKGIESGYFIVFSICAVCYLIGWLVIKALVPRYKLITDL